LRLQQLISNWGGAQRGQPLADLHRECLDVVVPGERPRRLWRGEDGESCAIRRASPQKRAAAASTVPKPRIGRMPIRCHLLWSMAYHINGLLEKSLSCLHIPLLARAWNPPNCHPDRSPDTHTTTSHARVPVGFIDRAGCPGLSTSRGFAIDPVSTERNVLPSRGWLHV
jgi:hypothetical protein